MIITRAGRSAIWMRTGQLVQARLKEPVPLVWLTEKTFSREENTPKVVKLAQLLQEIFKEPLPEKATNLSLEKLPITFIAPQSTHDKSTETVVLSDAI